MLYKWWLMLVHLWGAEWILVAGLQTRLLSRLLLQKQIFWVALDKIGMHALSLRDDVIMCSQAADCT